MEYGKLENNVYFVTCPNFGNIGSDDAKVMHLKSLPKAIRQLLWLYIVILSGNRLTGAHCGEGW